MNSGTGLRFEGVEVVLGGRTALAVQACVFGTGELSCLEGVNGSGKTTLLLAAAGLLDLARGTIWLDDRLHHRGLAPAPRAHRLKIGVAFQEPYFFAGSVADNVAYGLACRRVPRKERLRRVEAVLEQLGARSLGARRASELSGGERKIVGLARTLVVAPEVLLLDEPTAFLDPAATLRVETLLQEIVRAGRTSVVLATHDPAQAARLTTRRLRLENGRLEAAGRPDSDPK